MSARAAVRAGLLALLLCATTTCTERNVVYIDLGFNGGVLPIGFDCRDASDALVIKRSVTERAFSVRLDYLSLGGGVPGCRGADLRNWCSRHRCAPVPGVASFCREAVYPPGTSAEGMAQDLLESLLAEVATKNAPDGVVMVRVIGTTQPCSQALDPAHVVGCAHSCPLPLDQSSGVIRLDLPGTGGDCEEALQVCASSDYRVAP